MKPTLFNLFVVAGAAAVLAGCGGSSSSTDQGKSTAAAPSPSAPPAASAPSAAPPPGPAAPTAAAAPAAPAPSAAAPAPAAAAPAAAATAASSLASQLTAMASAQKDQVLGSIGTELAGKVSALTQSAAGDSALKSQVENTVQSLVVGKDSSALSSIYQTVQAANLTPQQLQLAKDTGNLATAFVVQRNFSSLEGSQSDVATIVNSLRKGEIMPAVPAIEKVAQNANLTAPQKQLIGSIADKYAPGVTKAAGSLQQGLQGLRGLTK